MPEPQIITHSSDLQTAIKKERLDSYAVVRGGYPVLLAGATYWAALVLISLIGNQEIWYWSALFGSGLIFPIAVLYARIFRNTFLSHRSALTDLLAPTFIGMLLFWPIAIAALWSAIDLFPLVLAIGLSLHFPVIGWMYGKSALYVSHAVVRAVAVFVIWWRFPDHQLLLIPACVALIYVLTAALVFVDSRTTN